MNICKNEYKNHDGDYEQDVEEYEEDYDIPPHDYLARSRGGSYKNQHTATISKVAHWLWFWN